MCFCDPQSSCHFSDGNVSLHQGKKKQRERERDRQRRREKHPWLFAKHSLFYLCEAVRDLPSLSHLSLISDKALFKCLLSWPIHDWHWHLRNTSGERRDICGLGGTAGSAHFFSFLFLSEPLICCSSEGAVSMATAPSSHSSVSRWGEFTPGWWAQWVITFCNENDWEIAKRSEAATERKGESPVRKDKRTNRQALKRDWMRDVVNRMSHLLTKACRKRRKEAERSGETEPAATDDTLMTMTMIILVMKLIIHQLNKWAREVEAPQYI